MGVFTYQNDNASSVSRPRLYKALVVDFDNLIPKIVEAAQTIEILEGNGGPGTLKKLTYVEDGATKYVIQKVVALDGANYVYNYSAIEGTGMPEGVEKMTFDMKLEEGPNGGSVGKVSVTYFTKTDAPPSEEELAAGKAKGEGLFKAVEAYLLAHPEYN
ncbi:class-10 pathogenesis-related protein 1-like [Neltuma alba]|uniref:class-10 pathogenesis-related protein 1-like n=1 Tax=Neltuma alba TaxID=207710 RepID=UPI0010A49F4B|nr:class-10 pathogenesis-related protein 1-like [Prosopis alba]